MSPATLALLALPPLVTAGASLMTGLTPVWALLLTMATGLIPAIWQLQRQIKTMQAQTARIQEFTQNLIDVIPQPVYVKDAQSRYLMVNEAFAEERHKTKAELMGISTRELAPNAKIENMVLKEDASVLAGASFYVERHDQTPEGNERYQLVMKGSCLDIHGQRVIVGTNFNVTPWRVAERDLEEALLREQDLHHKTLEYIQRLLDVIPYPVYVKDARSNYLLVNQAMAHDKGISRESLLGKTGLAPESSPETIQRHFAEDAEVLAGKRIYKEEKIRHYFSGKTIHRIITKGLCLDAQGAPVIVGARFDLTELREAEAKLKDSLERETARRQRTQEFIQRLLDLIPDPVYLKNEESRYLVVNDAFARERGYSKSEMIGMTSFDLAPDQDTAETSAREDHDVINGAQITKEQHTKLPLTGEECYRVVYKRRCIDVEGHAVVFGLHHYITRWKIAEREFQHQAMHDTLTGLANRRYFSEAAERAQIEAEGNVAPLSIIMLDLDHFKRVNDKYGHPVGDEVLLELVRRGQACLRAADLMARWGGEEFILLLPQTALDGAGLVAERVRALVEETAMATSCGPIPITVSCGVAQWQRGEHLEQLIGRADRALYKSKYHGRNRVHLSPMPES